MAGPYYVDASKTGGANTGADWTNAYLSFWSVPSLASGEIVYIASNHTESSVSGDKTITGPTSGAPALIYSVTSGTTTYAAGGKIQTLTAGDRITIDGAFAVYGVTFDSAELIVFSNDRDEQCTLVNCTLIPGPGLTIRPGGVGTSVSLINCTVSCASDTGASNQIFTYDNSGTWPYSVWLMLGGSFTNVSNRTGSSARVFEAVQFDCYGVDFSAIPSACELTNGNARVRLVGCKLPSTLALNTATPSGIAHQIELYDCPLGGGESDRLNLSTQWYSGDVTDNQTIYLSSGAESDDGNGGTQAFSHKLVSAALASESDPLCSPWYYVWNDTTGSRNLDIYVGAAETLDDSEVWAEYLYMGASGSEAYTYTNTNRATPLTSAAAISTTGGTWTGTGAPTEEYYLRKTATVNEKGWIMGRVCVGKPSLTVYVDPRIVLS